MQVSWIEPEEIRALVERLQDARPKARALGWELHTLPDELPGASSAPPVEAHVLWPQAECAPAEHPPAPAQQPVQPGAEVTTEPPSDQPELDRIRQKLRALRWKAEVAGLLRGVPEAAPQADEPVSKKEAAPPPEANPRTEDAPAAADEIAPVAKGPTESADSRAEEPPDQEQVDAAALPQPELDAGEPALPNDPQDLPHVVAASPPREIAPAMPLEEIFPTAAPDLFRPAEPHEAPAKPDLSDSAIADALHAVEESVSASAEDVLMPADAGSPSEAAGSSDSSPVAPDAPATSLAISGAADAAPGPKPKVECAQDATTPAQPEPDREVPAGLPERMRGASPFKLADIISSGSQAPLEAPAAPDASLTKPASDRKPGIAPTAEPTVALPPEPPAVALPAEPALPAVVLPGQAAEPPRMVIGVPPPMPRDAELSFEVPLGNMPERLQAFAGWAMRRTRTTEFLIVDAHGDVLWGRHVHAGLVVSTMLACTAALRSSAIGAAELLGVIEQPLPAEKILSVIPCQTCYGVINIAVVRREGVEEQEAALLRRALVAAIEARPPGSDAGPGTGAID